MNCRDAILRVTEFLATAGPRADPRDVLADALEHVTACPQCLEELAVMGLLITGRPTTLVNCIYEDAGCVLVQQLFPSWLGAEQAGESPEALNPAAWRHFSSCEQCQHAYAELKSLAAAATTGEFGVVPADAFAGEPLNDMRDLLPRLLDARGASELTNPPSVRETVSREYAQDIVVQDAIDHRLRNVEQELKKRWARRLATGHRSGASRKQSGRRK